MLDTRVGFWRGSVFLGLSNMLYSSHVIKEFSGQCYETNKGVSWVQIPPTSCFGLARARAGGITTG